MVTVALKVLSWCISTLRVSFGVQADYYCGLLSIIIFCSPLPSYSLSSPHRISRIVSYQCIHHITSFSTCDDFVCTSMPLARLVHSDQTLNPQQLTKKQDRDSRAEGQQERSTATMKLDSSGYARGDLDLMSNDDYFGPPILDLGSFDTGSPPRDPKAHRRPPERGSPSYNRNIYRYRPSPPPGYPQNLPPPGYYGGGPPPGAPHPGYGYPPPYHASSYPSDLQPWSSPQAYDFERPPPPHKPAYEARNASPTSKKARRWDGTPEKEKSKSRSPFRSPPSNQGSAKVSPVDFCLGPPTSGVTHFVEQIAEIQEVAHMGNYCRHAEYRHVWQLRDDGHSWRSDGWLLSNGTFLRLI